MEAYEIYKLIEDLKGVENFLLDIISNNKRVLHYGISSISHLDSYKSISETLPTLEARLTNFSRLSNIINPDIGAKFDDLIKKSDLSKASAEINVSMKISERTDRVNLVSVLGLSFSALEKIFLLGFKSGTPFQVGGTQIDIKGILIDIERIVPMLISVRDEMYARLEDNFEGFTPSNISIDNVNTFIQKALIIISETGSMPPETKENVEKYLKEVKSELARDTPAWKRVVGALVIVSAILSGLASAPAALENVREALNEILGTSIDELAPKPQDNRNQLPNFTITKKPSDQDTQDA